MNVRSRVGALAAAAVLTLTAAACGTDNSMSMPMGGTPGANAGAATTGSMAGGSSAVDAAHNDADVMFAQQMIVHHRGAIAMAELAPDRAQSADVKALAKKITAAQGPEIQQMSNWLQAWGTAPMTESSGMGDMGGMDHGTTGNDGSGSASPMPGMMTDEQMQQLTAAKGAVFDKMFLEMMIAHHEGAIEMSKTEKASGKNTDALALADAITTSQTAEIAEMKALLQGM